MSRTYQCTDVHAVLSAAIDDELDTDSRHLVECHLSSCAACRAMIDQAERLDELVRSDALLLAGDDPFPASAADLVIARTVRSGPARSRTTGLFMWSGWIAAAAMLAMTVYLRSPSMTPPSGGGSPNVGNRSAALTASWQRSWTWEGDDVETSAIATTPQGAAEQSQSFATAMPAPVQAALTDTWRRSTLRSDLEALHSTAIVLETFADIDEKSIRTLESIREVVILDELMPRLARIRTVLEADDRRLITAAETLLFRIAHDPLSQTDLEDMRDLVRRADLAEALWRMGDRGLARRNL